MSGKLDSNPGSQVPRFHSHPLIMFYQCDLRNRVGWLGTWRAPPNTLLQGTGTEEPTFISKSLPQGRSKAPSARKVTSPLFPHLPLPQTNQLGLVLSGPSLHGGLGKQLSVGPGSLRPGSISGPITLNPKDCPWGLPAHTCSLSSVALPEWVARRGIILTTSC